MLRAPEEIQCEIRDLEDRLRKARSEAISVAYLVVWGGPIPGDVQKFRAMVYGAMHDISPIAIADRDVMQQALGVAWAALGE